jgi:hypothetical protein
MTSTKTTRPAKPTTARAIMALHAKEQTGTIVFYIADWNGAVHATEFNPAEMLEVFGAEKTAALFRGEKVTLTARNSSTSYFCGHALAAAAFATSK